MFLQQAFSSPVCDSIELKVPNVQYLATVDEILFEAEKDLHAQYNLVNFIAWTLYQEVAALFPEWYTEDTTSISEICVKFVTKQMPLATGVMYALYHLFQQLCEKRYGVRLPSLYD